MLVFIVVFSYLFYKSKRLPLLVAPPRPADAIHIIVVCLRDVVIDDMADIGDIQASRGHIGRHQNLGVIILEFAERSLALDVIFVAVNGFGFDAFSHKHSGQFFHSALGAAEHEHFAKLFFGQKIVQDVEFIFSFRDSYHILVHVFGSVAFFDRNANRDMKKLADQFFNRRRKRRRKKQGLSFFRHARHNKSHFINESHIQHSVCFVQNNRVEFRKMNHLSVDKVFQSSRRADYKIILIAQFRNLPPDAHSSDYAHRIYFHAGGKVFQLAVYLNSQLASRGDNQNLFLPVESDFVYKPGGVDVLTSSPSAPLSAVTGRTASLKRGFEGRFLRLPSAAVNASISIKHSFINIIIY